LDQDDVTSDDPKTCNKMKIDILSNLTEALEQENLKDIVESGQAAYSSYVNLIKDQEKVIEALHPASNEVC